MRLLRFTTIRIIILFIALCAGKQVFAATGSVVTVNLNVLPPYSPFYRDYAGYTNNKTVITLLYQSFTSGTPIQVFLSGSIRKDDNKISVQLKDTYRPSIPITLTPNLPKTLTGAQLRNIFGNGSSNDLIMNGITAREIMMNQALPEGNYNVCVQVKDYATGQALSEACQNIYIAYYEPPQMFWPQNNSTVMATEPQNIITSWSPVTPAIPGLNYRLRVAKLLPGVTPSDALSRSTQVVYEKSDIKIPTFPLDLSSGLRLDTGSMYVMQVVAYSPGAYFKNNGQSDPVMFYYKGAKKIIMPLHTSPAQFTFFNPRMLKNKPDTLKVNSENRMLINWGWMKSFANDTSTLVDVEQIQKLGLQKYKLTISKVSGGQVIMEKTFERNNNDSIRSYLQLSENEAENAGFINGEKYRAAIDAIDKNGVIYNSFNSNQFVFSKINDNEAYVIKVKGVLNYLFKGFPEVYPVKNTGVEIVAYKSKTIREQVSFGPYFSKLPVVSCGKEAFVKIASQTVTTDENGSINTSINVPKTYFKGDSIYYRLKIGNRYYVDTDFRMLSVAASKIDSSVVDFGQQVAKTYAYRLKLNVKKKFTYYKLTKDETGFSVKLSDGDAPATGSNNAIDDKTQSHTYGSGDSQPVANIPVVLYRENKSTDIPYFEGDITREKNEKLDDTLYKGGNHNITVVAVGMTQLEGKNSYAVFDKLLATDMSGEEYKILAIKDLDKWLSDQKGKQETAISALNGKAKVGDISTVKKSSTRSEVNNRTSSVLSTADFSVIANAISDYTSNRGSGNTNFVDSTNFVAEVKPFTLPLPKTRTGEEDFYRTVTADYDIISCKPPTSVFRGRLFYVWQSNKGVKRPLAKTHFKVMVDYVDANNKSVGSVSVSGSPYMNPFGSNHSVTFVPDKNESSQQGIPLIDQYATMAQGTTDADGNFVIETVNFDQKGDLGSGTLSYTDVNNKAPVSTQTEEDKMKEVIDGRRVINPSDGYASIFGSVGCMNNRGTQSNVERQGSINGAFNVGFDNATGSVELNKPSLTGKTAAGMTKGMSYSRFVEDDTRGPNPSAAPVESPLPNDVETKSVHYAKFSRTFRIVIDGDAAGYYYPSKEAIVIQPFENCTTPKEITHFVREFELRTYPKELDDKKNKLSLSDMQVTLFRDLKSKPANLPQGEGDGKYTYKELINPEYNINQGAKSYAKEINASGVFSSKFEQLWSAIPTQKSAAGSIGATLNAEDYAPMRGLLQAELSHYFVESSSFVDKSSNAYQATIDNVTDYAFDVANADWTNPKIPVVEQDIVLTPLISRALITVRDLVSHKVITSDYNARVVAIPDNKTPTFFDCWFARAVDKYGKVEMHANTTPLSNWVKDPSNPQNIYFTAMANGYKNSEDQSMGSFTPVGYQFIKDISIAPSGKIKGKIVTTDNNKTGYLEIVTPTGPKPVQSYLQVDSGQVFQTGADGTFNISVPLLKNSKFKIIPNDVAYFDSTYIVTEADSKKPELNLTIYLLRRKHRIEIQVTQKMNKNQSGPPAPVNGATVQLGSMIRQADAKGVARFEFENVSVNNYTFVIRGPEGSNYIPKTVNIPNEESQKYMVKNVALEKGSEVSGTVTLDGKPAKHARVYIDVSNTSSETSVIPNSSLSPNKATTTVSLPGSYASVATKTGVLPLGSITDDANLIVAYSDNAGKYTLKGVPVDNQKINIRATMDTTFTVSGDMQPADIFQGKAVADLRLTSFNKAVINKIYGFPLTVEKITPVSDTQVKVSGLLHWTEAISDFKLNEVAKSVRIEETLFDLIDKEGKTTGVANGAEVKLSGINSLKLSYLDKYNVVLTRDGNAFSSQPLTLRRENDYGKISGKIAIADNSFNYPSSYLSFNKNEFYLSKPLNDSTVNNIVDVVTSAKTETESTKKEYSDLTIYRQNIAQLINMKPANRSLFNICDANAKPIQFKLIRFDATANPAKSFIDNAGRIHLNADLTCKIKNAQPEKFTLNIPEIILDENKVSPTSGSTPIKVKLEEWTLEVKNWKFSVEEGGIYSNNAAIHTKLLDIPMKKFVLRNDMFLMDQFQMNNLTLAGGIFKLDVNNGVEPKLNYEYKVGSDMKPHWNFNMISSGLDKVGSIKELEGLYNTDLTTKYPVEFNYIQILSNDEMLVQLKQQDAKARLLGNKLASFEPLSIYSGPNYISVNGLLNTDAPRVSDISLNAVWTSPTKNPDFEKVSTDFEGKGFVHFIANKNNIAITKDLISIDGKVVEKPSKTFNPIPSVFYARSNASPTYEVMMRKDWVTQLTGDEPEGTTTPVTSNSGYNLILSEGGMSAAKGGDWSTCTFSGLMRNNKAAGKDNADSDNISDCVTKFEVLGDISANSSGVAVKGINTPLGSMSQTFDFAKKQLIGSLKIKTDVNMGGLVLHSGTIETCFDPDGFYVAGGCYAFVPAGILSGNYNLGLMAGSYTLTNHLWDVTNSYIDPSVVNTCYKQKTSRLSGFYTAFNRELFNVNISKNYVLASGYVRALGLIGGDGYVNISNGWKIGFDGYVHIDVGAGLSAITGTSISGGIKGDGNVMFQIGTPSYFQASVLLDFEAKISQSLGFTSISKSISVGCSATGGTNGFSFSLGSGGQKLGCP